MNKKIIVIFFAIFFTLIKINNVLSLCCSGASYCNCAAYYTVVGPGCLSQVTGGPYSNSACTIPHSGNCCGQNCDNTVTTCFGTTYYINGGCCNIPCSGGSCGTCSKPSPYSETCSSSKNCQNSLYVCSGNTLKCRYSNTGTWEWVTFSSLGTETACSDGYDNDCDGYTDCFDTDCVCCSSNGGTCTTGSTCCSGLCVEGYCRSSCSSYNGERCSDDANAYTASASGICARDYNGIWSCAKNEVSYYATNYYTDCYEPFNGAPTSSLQCDTDVDPSYSALGICVYSSGTISTSTVNCDTSETCFDGTYYRDSCSNCYTSGSTARSCDSDGGTSYNANGICVFGGSCATSQACFDDTYFQSSCSSCSYDYDLDPNGDSCDSSVSDGLYNANGLCTYNNICTPSGTTIRVDLSNNNYFVAGCSNGGGDICDIDGGTSFQQTGICTQGYVCDGSDVTLQYGIYYGNCSSRGGFRCMKDATSGFFTQTGLCFDSGGNQENINFGCVISGFVYYNGTHYKNSSQVTIEDYNYTKDNDGKSCDSTLTNGDFNPDGMLTLNGCSAVGSTVRVDKNNNYYFTENCDNSASQCAIVSSSLNSPWQKTGVCCSNSCQGYADSNCCSDSDCGAEAICYDYECVGKAIGIQIRNLGLTGFEQINQSVTSIRSVMLNLVFNSTLAQKCRYINFDDNSNVPSNDSEDWSQWETCISTKVWELNPSQGLKTVYYQIDYGSYFKIANDSIYYNSSGGGLDITPPNPPYIIDGEFTNNLTILKISWFNASDPESEILNIPLIYKVNAFSNGVYTNTITTRSNTYNLDISNLNLQNNSVIYVNVTVVNSAGLTAETISDGVIVDTEKPQGTNVEGYFLNITNNLWTSFNYNLINENTYVAAKNVNLTWKEKFSDAISGIDAYSYIISKDINANVDDIPEGSIGNFDKEVSKIFNLASGKYYFKVKAKDKAGNWGLPIIFNFSIDSTYPSFPKLISLNYSNKYLTAKWQTSTDPESDVYGYNLTIINSTLKPVYSIIVSGKDTNEYTFDLSSFSTDDYNLTIGAINFAGLISWNYQTKYADFEPPNIIAKPNNSLVITNEPIIAVWTDEDAICYYNNSNEFIEFIYTNTTYHETKLNLDYDYYIYKIKCSDMYDNSAEVLINFTITNKEVANLIINPITKLYENIISKILINLTDSSNNLLVGADVDLIKIEGFDNKDIFVLDNLDGTYTIEFNSPKAGEYNLNLKYNALEQPLNLNFEKLYLYAQFNNPLYNNPSELNKENRIIYKSDNGYIFGLASENIETNTNLSLNISINEPIFIINTKENSLIKKRDRQLVDKEFSKLKNPLFGYSLNEKDLIDFILKYDFPIVSNDLVVSKGKFNYYIKNSKQDNKKIIVFSKE